MITTNEIKCLHCNWCNEDIFQTTERLYRLEYGSLERPSPEAELHFCSIRCLWEALDKSKNLSEGHQDKEEQS